MCCMRAYAPSHYTSFAQVVNMILTIGNLACFDLVAVKPFQCYTRITSNFLFILFRKQNSIFVCSFHSNGVLFVYLLINDPFWQLYETFLQTTFIHIHTHKQRQMIMEIAFEIDEIRFLQCFVVVKVAKSNYRR